MELKKTLYELNTYKAAGKNEILVKLLYTTAIYTYTEISNCILQYTQILGDLGEL